MTPACTKTIFSLNGEYYKQTDGVSMGSPLGPTLANIIMTEFETVIIKPLINSGIIVFYKRYVDDTLVLAKPTDIKHMLILSIPSTVKYNSLLTNFLTMTYTS